MGQIDEQGYKTSDGMVQTALKDMINRLTAEQDDSAEPDDSTEPDDSAELTCDDYLAEAYESITSIEQYLAGSRSDWIEFDDDDISADTPVACLEELRQKKLEIINSDNFSMFLYDDKFSAN